MSMHATKSMLLLVPVSILLHGCADGPISPVADADAPQFGKTSSASAALSGGIDAGAQSVTIGADSRTRMELYSNTSGFVHSIDLAGTRAVADAGQCSVKNNGGDLGQFLLHAATLGTIHMIYDKTTITSANHMLGITWVEGGVRMRVKLKGGITGFPKLTVTTQDLGGGTKRYTISGGAVNVERVLNGVKNFDELFCTNQDVVMVDVTR